MHDIWLIVADVALAALFLVLPHELDGPAYRILLPWAEALGWLAFASAVVLLAALLGPRAGRHVAWAGRVLGALVAGAVGVLLLPVAWPEGVAFLLLAGGAVAAGPRWRQSEVWGGLALAALALCALMPPGRLAWFAAVGVAGGCALAASPWLPRWRAVLYLAALLAAGLVIIIPDRSTPWLSSALALAVGGLVVAAAIAPWLPLASAVYSRLLRGIVAAAVLPLLILGVPAMLSTRANVEQRAQENLRLQARLVAAFVNDAMARAARTIMADASLVVAGSSAELEKMLAHVGPPTGAYALWLHDAGGRLVAATTAAAPPAALPPLPGPLPGGAAAAPLVRVPQAGTAPVAVISLPLADGRRLSAVLTVPQLPADDGSDQLAGLLLDNAPHGEVGRSAPFVADDGAQRWLIAEQPVAQTPWIVRAQEPIRDAYRNATLVAFYSGASHLAALLILVVLAAALARGITRPLHALAEAFAALARGEPARVTIATNDEFAYLGRAFNALTGELERSRAALTELNRTLEERIHERTAELAEAQAQLERYAADIHAAYRAERARSREVEEFVYAVSHDLKTPLVSIQSYAAVLRRGGLDPATQDRYLDRLARNAEHMERLMQALLELARAGSISEPRVPVATAAMVRELCEARAEPEGRPIAFAISPSLPTVRAERGKLERVFANLIDNAVKYLGPQAQPRIEVGAEAQDAVWCFWVRDNGAGIPAEVQGRLFRPFFRAPDHANVPGSGMGLALARKIIRAHGGEMWVESAVGAGTTVYFTLPRYHDDDTVESHDRPAVALVAPSDTPG